MLMASRTMMRWRLIALVYAIALLFLLFQGGKTSLMLFSILNVLILYLILGKWSGISKATGSRKLVSGSGAQEQTLVAGAKLDVSLSVHVPGLWPIPYVLVRDRLVRQNGSELPFEMSFVPRYRRDGEISYTTPPLERGIYHFAPTSCSTQDIFGLFEHTGNFETSGSFQVYPRTVPIRQWRQLHSGVKGPYSTSAMQRASKETTQINGVREYIYGDRLSRIHWNATAKTGQWRSKEFEREALPRTIFVIDRYSGAYETSEQFELAVSSAASMAQFAFRRSTSIGLLSVGSTKEVLEALPVPDQLTLMMNHFVRIQPDGDIPLYRMLRQSEILLPYGSFVVLLTPQRGEETIRAMEWLSRRGAVPMLLHMKNTAVQPENASSDWLDLLNRGGYPVYSIGQLQELPAVLEGGA